MSEEHAVSRRASLKTIGAIGAAIAIGGPAAVAQAPVKPPAVAAGSDKQPTDLVEVAADRMTKGHS